MKSMVQINKILKPYGITAYNNAPYIYIYFDTAEGVELSSLLGYRVRDVEQIDLDWVIKEYQEAKELLSPPDPNPGGKIKLASFPWQTKK